MTSFFDNNNIRGLNYVQYLQRRCWYSKSGAVLQNAFASSLRSSSLAKLANEEKTSLNKLLFPNDLAQHALKMLAQISLHDVI